MADEAAAWQQDDAFEEEEDIDETGYKSVKDAVLFAIEISESMLTPPPDTGSKRADKESPATAALKCAYHLMQQRIISNPKDMIGILLYGTEESKFYDEDESGRGSLSYPHCYLFSDLDVPAAEDVKKLRALVHQEEEAEQILVPSKERVSMSNVLFCANQIFSSKAPNFSSRRLFIVTDNDDPHSKDKALRSAATVRAKDLYDLGVMIELFPISQPNKEFDWSKFFDDIIYKASPTDPEAPAFPTAQTKTSTSGGDGISLLKSLLSSINSKSVPRRALFSNVPLEIGPDFKISVTGYLIFKRQEPARSCYIWLGGEVPQIAKGITTQMADDSAREVEKWEIKKAYKFGGEQISFTQEEQASLRNFGEPTIRIIGFKPLSALPIWASMKHPTFIYPTEEGYVGSTRVFSALYQTLLKKEKLALVWFVPPLQWHYRILQALALDEDLPEQPEDKTVPKYRQIDKRAGEFVIAWGKELESQHLMIEAKQPATSTLVKRPASRAQDQVKGDSRPTKKTKTSPDAAGVGDEVKLHYEKGTLNKLTAAVLKEFLQSQHLSTTGKKADLIERVEEFLEQK
ncbi:Ku70 [Histoplasma capsulatum H143]|uniref:ATP-dependent DNA helicase II subunit 1 n=1 Tax=Ajellomyces capsulatus (strain H143) TaxID=544712 RepID=C6HST2_AJECH|nr:Ku70 [Histoplasma capsulatum H143]